MAKHQSAGEGRSTGALFVLEGPDSVGKTTLASRVELALAQALNRPVARIAFPGRAPGTLGAHIHDLHENPHRFGIRNMTSTSLQALHLAAHLDAIETQIRPLLQEGSIVLLDRYWWSTWVFGVVSGADQRALKAMIELEQAYWGTLQPKAIFLIDRSIQNVGSREQVFERVRREYAALAAQETSRTTVILIQNDGPLESASNLIVDSMLQLVAPATAKSGS